jgi:inward rectifier potassium channel
MKPPVRPPVKSYTVTVLGAQHLYFRDAYHAFLRITWRAAIALIVVFYLTLNALFALAYMVSDGVVNAAHGSFVDAYYFSIQTMGTIGYGAMYPRGPIANALVILESVSGLLITAVVTGLVFAKFSHPTARLVFCRTAVISPMEGVPTLMFRVGNERSNQIIDAHIRVVLMRTELTKEGTTFYRMHDLVLSRERSPALTRSVTVMHPITPKSPLYGQTPESIRKDEVELQISVMGLDDTSYQPVHAQSRYNETSIVWGARLADVLSEDADGNVILDLRKFHEIVPTRPQEGFPYPAVEGAVDVAEALALAPRPETELEGDEGEDGEMKR